MTLSTTRMGTLSLKKKKEKKKTAAKCKANLVYLWKRLTDD